MGHYYQKVLTKKLSPVVWNLGFDQIFKKIYAGRGQILMFHRVIPKTDKPRIHNHLSLEITPEHLNATIEYFRKRKYEFIRLDDLTDWLNINANNKKKFVIFTFDDGYVDNLEFAYPVFKRQDVPFTIYITTSFPEKMAVLWWYILEEIILNHDSVNYTHNGREMAFDCSDVPGKEKAFNEIRKLIMSYNETERDSRIEKFVTDYGFTRNHKNANLVLSWEQIIQLSHDPLVSIGAHTLNHYNLCAISLNDAQKEILQSKLLIESKIGKRVDHFSYPLGKYSEEIVAYCREVGFKTATTTKNANIFKDHLSYMYTLPRININSLTTAKVLRLHVNGFFPAILNRLKKIVAF